MAPPDVVFVLFEDIYRDPEDVSHRVVALAVQRRRCDGGVDLVARSRESGYRRRLPRGTYYDDPMTAVAAFAQRVRLLEVELKESRASLAAMRRVLMRGSFRKPKPKLKTPGRATSAREG